MARSFLTDEDPGSARAHSTGPVTIIASLTREFTPWRPQCAHPPVQYATPDAISGTAKSFRGTETQAQSLVAVNDERRKRTHALSPGPKIALCTHHRRPGRVPITPSTKSVSPTTPMTSGPTNRNPGEHDQQTQKAATNSTDGALLRKPKVLRDC